MNVHLYLILTAFFLVFVGILLLRSRSFKLIIKPGKKILWQDEDKNLRMDVSVGFYNAGVSTGIVEEVVINFHQGENRSVCQPDMVYRFNDEGKLAPAGFWGPFVLNGKHHREQMIGFKTNLPISDLSDGNYDITLNVRYYKNVRQNKIQEVSHSFQVEFQRRDVLRDKIHSQEKKQPFFPFDPNILQGLFTPKSGE